MRMYERLGQQGESVWRGLTKQTAGRLARPSDTALR
jgi:hypothetical protein